MDDVNEFMQLVNNGSGDELQINDGQGDFRLVTWVLQYASDLIDNGHIVIDQSVVI